MDATKIDPGELMSLEEYKLRHQEIRREIIAIRDLRRIEVGPWVSFTFENRRTVLYQIQEMIRAEHLTDPAKVREEIDAYEELLPAPGELSATMFIEIPDPAQRELALSQLGGIEKTITLNIGRKRARTRDKRPIDPRFERPGRASAVYYLGFRLPAGATPATKETVRLEIAHPAYGHAAVIPPRTLAALAQDLPEFDTIGRSSPSMSGTLKAYLAEILGTFVLVFAAAGSASMAEIYGSGIGLMGLALAYGAGAAAASFAFGPASGGHFNPAITAGMFIARRIDAVAALFYLISQLLGAAAAGLFLKAVLHGAPALGSCDLSGVGFRAGTLIEAASTFLLVSTFMATAGIRRGPARLGPLAVGLAVTVGVLATGPATGAAMNPARAFGPAVATGRWSHWYVYWIGPLAGGVCAALLQENIFKS